MGLQIIQTRNLILRALCAIYMFAFTSLYVQIPGLYGPKGLLPAHVQLGSFPTPKECFLQRKTLLCGAEYFGLSVSLMMELLSLIGAVFAFIGFVWNSWCTTPLFIILWGFYLSLYQVGQTFLWFQWDILLLEIGFLAIFVAPLIKVFSVDNKPRNIVTMWLVRWALFRLMFASGVVKLQSGCPTWWGLTALNVHYESQCLPTPLSWFMHQLPDWWQKLSVVGVYVIEIPIAFFFFSPIRGHRIFAFYAQIMLQVMIILTGNYNFFNLLTIVMCFSLLDDVHLGYRYIKSKSVGLSSRIQSVIHLVFKWSCYAALIYGTLAYFAMRLSPSGAIESSVDFTKEGFESWISKAVPFSIAIGSISLFLTIAEALTASLFETKGTMQKFMAFSVTLIYSFVAISLFGMSLIPYSSLHIQTSKKIWPGFRNLYDSSTDYMLTSSYGLFRHMTGVDGRPEVILEGANDMKGPWIEYEFPYKPGKVDRMLPIVAPHQPRLDWQMWFAALGTYNMNPWIVSMSFRLLQGNKDVVALLDSSSPWVKKPPKYIRGVKYTYHYTSTKESSANWWSRKREGEYMPTYSVDHQPLIDYLKKLQLVGKKDINIKNSMGASILKKIREVLTVTPPQFLLFALFVTALLIMLTKRSRN